MSTAEQDALKQIVKDAIKEVVAENSEALREIIVEAIEDTALLQRMEEGRTTELVDRAEVMGLLEPKP